MKNKEKFDKTVSILVKAYLNDELAHKLCCACAVGNIVADALGTKPMRSGPETHVEFNNNLFENGENASAWYTYLKNECAEREGERQVKLTGYTREQLFEIESAFERAPGEPNKEPGMYRGKCTDPEWMFNGLMAVVEVLAEIHEINISEIEQAKALFCKT